MSEDVAKPSNEKKPPESKNVLGSMVKPATVKEPAKESKDKPEAKPKDDKAKSKEVSQGKAGENVAASNDKKKKSAGKSEEKVVHTVTFELTEEDFSKKGKEAAELQGELNKLEYEFQGVKEEYKAKTSLIESDCSRVLSTIRRGKEEREVECVKMIDFDLGLVEFWHKGKLVEKRGIRADEKQQSLFK